MPFISYFPYPVYVGSILIFVIMIIYAMIKGYDQLHTNHLDIAGIESIILAILLIIQRTIKEFKIFTSMQSIISTLTTISLAVLLITVFILAIPKLRYDHYHMRMIKISCIIILIGICLIIIGTIFPNPFAKH